MVYRKAVRLQSNDRVCTFHNVTQQAKEALRESGIQNGIVVVYSHHTTCSVITQESAFDLSMTGLETLQQDLVNVMERIMLDIMFKLPSLPDVKGCLINQAVIEKGKEPVLLYADDGDFPAEALEDQTV